MQDRIKDHALEILRAIRERHPGITSGAWVDPYTAALDAGMNPDNPYYESAIEHLVNEGALQWAPETRRAVGNPIYRFTQRGIEMSGGS